MMGYTSRGFSSAASIVASSTTGRASDMHSIMADIFIPILVAVTPRTSAGLEATAEADSSAVRVHRMLRDGIGSSPAAAAAP